MNHCQLSNDRKSDENDKPLKTNDDPTPESVPCHPNKVGPETPELQQVVEDRMETVHETANAECCLNRTQNGISPRPLTFDEEFPPVEALRLQSSTPSSPKRQIVPCTVAYDDDLTDDELPSLKELLCPSTACYKSQDLSRENQPEKRISGTGRVQKVKAKRQKKQKRQKLGNRLQNLPRLK